MADLAPLILVTNDDGIHAPGLEALRSAMQEIGRAPERDNSAASHSLTMNRPLRVRKVDDNTFAIDGTPTDCVTIGIGKILTEKPALVVSGINPGGNLGEDISYSGTVSAAIEGTMLGVPAFAVSLAIALSGGETPLHFETAAAFARQLASLVLARGLPLDTLLNVNVPNRPTAEIAGVIFSRQGKRIYEDAIQETLDPWGRKHFWIGGGTPFWNKGPDTDAAVVASGRISITPIHMDRTNYEALRQLQLEWKELLVI